MGQQLFANNVSMKLASNLADTDTTFTVQSGQGAQCPVISASDDDWFLLTLIDKNGNREIVKIIEHETGSDVFTVGDSTSVPHVASLNGRAYEAIRGVQAAVAITASDDHAIKLALTAQTVEDAMAFGAVTASIAEINGALDGITVGFAELNQVGKLDMTGEASATSNSSSTTLNIGSVTNGDRIFVTASVGISGGTASSYAQILLQKSSGTSTIVIDYDNSIIYQSFMLGAAGTGNGRVSCVIQVTGDGTLVLNSVAAGTGSPSYTNNQIYAFFLKKT